MPGAVLLRTEQLTRSFGSFAAVSGVDVVVCQGELRSIIGPSGAGKTTLFRLVSGELRPSSGRVWFRDRDITGLPQHRVSRLGIAKSYQLATPGSDERSDIELHHQRTEEVHRGRD